MDTVFKRWLERGLPVVAAVVFVGVRLYVIASAHMLYDDAFITFRYAENLAHGLGFVYNPGERVLGTTTPLFTVILAAFALLGVPPHVAAPFLNLAFELATLWFLYRILTGGGADGAKPRWGWGVFSLAALLWALDPIGYEVGVAGMEMPLAVFFVAGFYWATREGRAGWAGTLAALAILTRIDAGFPVALIYGYFFLVRRRRNEWRPVLKSALVCVAVLVPCALLLGWYFGSPIPNSVFAKRFYSTLFTKEWIKATEDLLRYQVPLLFFDFPFRRLETGLFLWAALEVLVIRRAWKEWAGVAGLLLYPLCYYPAITFSGFITQRWYLYPGLPFFFVGVAVGVALLAKMTWPRFARFAALFFALNFLALAEVSVIKYKAFAFDLTAMVTQPLLDLAVFAGLLYAGPRVKWPLLAGAAAAYLLAALLLSFPGSYEAIRTYANGYGATNAEIGKWIRENRPGATVALGEVGFVGYFSGARIVDLVGLVQPEALKVRRESGLIGVFEHYRPDLLVFETQNGGDPAGSEFAKSVLFRREYRAAKTWTATPRGPVRAVRELTVFERIPQGP